MIKSNELRSGNWVSINGSKIRLNDKTLAFILSEDGENTRCQGIPLTEEILLKCGFEKDDFFYSFGSGTATSFVLVKGDIYFQFPDWSGRERIIIKHLHDLQNLYFALTRTELEVNL